MNEETLNIETRRFLKKVGITAQREIEHAVEQAVAEGRLAGSERLEAKMTLEVPALGIRHVIEGTIALE
ncbi:MAG: hypothetical protein D6786_05895 [Gammaproteobacteria bacterium]|nr:MAG: hypothetical protein D6786_05895 [Gammaproteobacteria bacterium]